MRNKLLPQVLIAVTLSILIAGFLPATPVGTVAQAGGGRGAICNLSSVPIWATVEMNANTRNSYWTVKTISPRSCINAITEDVEGIWGRQCNSRGQCSYQTWKLGDGVFVITDSFVSPIPPGKIVKINGGCVRDSCGWVSPDPSGPPSADWRHKKPSLNAIQYSLSR